jgi:hypothetical protein
VLKSIRIESLQEGLDVSPINDMKLTQRCKLVDKMNMDLNGYWIKIFVMVDS